MNGLNAYGLGAAASAFGTLGSSGAIRIPQGDPVRELSDAGTNSNDLNQNDAEESQTGLPQPPSLRPVDDLADTVTISDAAAEAYRRSVNPDPAQALEASALQGQNGGTKAGGNSDDPNQLSEEEQKVVKELQARDREVRAHEQAHAAAGAPHTGAISYTYQQGPDGRNYAIGGEVSIDTSPVDGDPEATLDKARQIKAAALAPAEPSGQDRAVAAQADALAAQAQAEIREKKAQEQEALREGDNPESLSPDTPAPDTPAADTPAADTGLAPNAEPGNSAETGLARDRNQDQGFNLDTSEPQGLAPERNSEDRQERFETSRTDQDQANTARSNIEQDVGRRPEFERAAQQYGAFSQTDNNQVGLTLVATA